MLAWGICDEQVDPWAGMLAGNYSDQDADMDDGYGVKYEHTAIVPSILLSFAPWRSARHNAELMQALPYTTGCGVLLRDRDGGEVKAGKDGYPIVKWGSRTTTSTT